MERYDTTPVFPGLLQGSERQGGCGLEEVGADSPPAQGSPGMDLRDVPDKYWDQRYRLFRLFDRGIALDPESWFSVSEWE